MGGKVRRNERLGDRRADRRVRRAAEADSRDDADAQHLYRLLESEVAPPYYERDASGFPLRWLALMRRSMQTVAPRFCARRMVKEYIEHLYHPGWDSAVRRSSIIGDAARQG